mmetsp:Transcript_64759/g.204472  ORF Transcript_64759/g.204472 Transcript_64759/m.204472 type:complete len:336 (+) Transcript_64759:734-1741(+)
MSHAALYRSRRSAPVRLCRISGAMNPIVPQVSKLAAFPSTPNSLASPRSASLQVVRSAGSSMRTLSGFTSQCTRRWVCMKRSAGTSCLSTARACASESCLTSCSSSWMSPPGMSSSTSTTSSMERNMSTISTTPAWRSCMPIEISSRASCLAALDFMSMTLAAYHTPVRRWRTACTVPEAPLPSSPSTSYSSSSKRCRCGRCRLVGEVERARAGSAGPGWGGEHLMISAESFRLSGTGGRGLSMAAMEGTEPVLQHPGAGPAASPGERPPPPPPRACAAMAAVCARRPLARDAMPPSLCHPANPERPPRAVRDREVPRSSRLTGTEGTGGLVTLR